MLHILTEGGVFMIPLMLGSAIAVGIAMERALLFAKFSSTGAAFRQELGRLLDSGDLDGARKLAGGEGPARACALAAIEHWGCKQDTVEAAMSAQAKEYEPMLNRFLGILETIVTAAPLIGLLGTITGMMSVFRTVALKLANDPHANTTGITAGIGEALVATATGIFVAVLALFIHNAFQGLAENRMAEAEQTAETIRLAYAKKSA
jgi:biopolymer transport protein ExbB